MFRHKLSIEVSIPSLDRLVAFLEKQSNNEEQINQIDETLKASTDALKQAVVNATPPE